MGQTIGDPPNVAGWPGGKHWIDSSSLMLRLRFPQLLYAADAIQARPKDDDDLMMGMPEQKKQRQDSDRGRAGQFVRTRIHWESFTDHFRDAKDDQVLADIRHWLLQTDSAIPDVGLKKYLDQTGQDKLVQSATIRLMSTPEYQLC